jgi:predicted alpha/beta hydrolase family esterase
MKNVLILHGTQADSKSNWFTWLKEELDKRGFKTWLPDLPNSNLPSLTGINKFIFSNKDWEFNSDSIIVGHSSGAIAILSILSELPSSVVLDECILVSYFTEGSSGGKWELNAKLFDYDFDFARISKHAKKFIIVHSGNDPYAPLEDAKALAEKLGGELIIKKDQGHFNLEKSPEYRQFPDLLNLIVE